MSSLSTGRATLIYDGHCPLCRKAVAWVERRAYLGAVALVACQSEERARLFPGLSEGECMAAMQFVLPDGRVLSGGEAFPEILVRMRGWAWLAGFRWLPGAIPLASWLYRRVSPHRQLISAILFRKEDRPK